MARDPLMGRRPGDGPPGARGGRSGVVVLLVGIIVVAVVIGAAFYLLNTPSPSVPIDNQSAPVASPTPVASGSPSPEPALNASPPPFADFVITGMLVTKRLTVEQLRAATREPRSLCRNEPLTIRNDTAMAVTLLDTPEDSDATIELGTVKPRAVFRFSPNEAGTYFVRDRAGGGWLFMYKVGDCGVLGGNGPAIG